MTRKKLPGDVVTKINETVSMHHMEPNHKKMMEDAVDGYCKHMGFTRDEVTSNPFKVGKKPSIYQFAYWLFRYSGFRILPPE